MRTPIFLVSLLLAAGSAVAQTAPAPAPFAPGEHMEYAVTYGPIAAGSMTIRVAGLEPYEGRSAYHLLFEAQSNRAVSLFFDLATTEESWFDAAELYSLRYRREAVENGKERQEDVRFDQENHLRIEDDGDTKPASPRAVDPIAMMYYLRTLPLHRGAMFVLRNQANPEDNPVRVRVLKEERVRVPAGTFDTYVVDLDVKTNKGFFKKGGENRIWMTKDARRIPVRISSKVGLGSFHAELVELSEEESS